MAIDGGRGSPGTSSPTSRRAAPSEAGILSAWVGTTLVMLVTASSRCRSASRPACTSRSTRAKNWVTDVIEINITNLAGVPSIVYGLLALGLFVYQFGFGQSILSAGLTLALLILPVVIVATREAIRSIPQCDPRGARTRSARPSGRRRADHVVPYSPAGILTGVIIGMARAIGETAPIITIGALTFIAFLPPSPVTSEPPFLSFEWLMSPFTVMPIQMFNWMSRPEAAFHQNAAAAGLVLVLMTLAMNGAGDLACATGSARTSSGEPMNPGIRERAPCPVTACPLDRGRR